MTGETGLQQGAALTWILLTRGDLNSTMVPADNDHTSLHRPQASTWGEEGGEGGWEGISVFCLLVCLFVWAEGEGEGS